MDSYAWPVIIDFDYIACPQFINVLWKNNLQDHLCQISRSSGEKKTNNKKQNKLLADATAGSRETLPVGFELPPTHGQVHIPMSTKAAEMCLHATPTASRAASNDHHMLTFHLLPALEHMGPADESNQGKLLRGIMKTLNSTMQRDLLDVLISYLAV